MALNKEDAVFLLSVLDLVQVQNVSSIKNAYKVICKLEKLAEVKDVGISTKST